MFSPAEPAGRSNGSVQLADQRAHDTRPVASTGHRLGRTSSRARDSLSSFLLPLRPRSSRIGLRAVELTGKNRWLWIGVDLAALLVLSGLAATAFRITFGTNWVWVTCVGGAVVGMAVGLVAALRNLPTWLAAVALAVGYLVLGSALAMPGQSSSMVIPTVRTLRQLVFGVVTSWKQVLTIAAPIGETQSLLVVPLITMMLAGLIGVTIALRSARPGWAWVAPAGAATVGVLFGVQTAFWPAVLAVGFVVVVLTWTGYRRDFCKQTLLGNQRHYAWQSAVSAVGVLVLASGCAVLAQPVVAPDTYRHVLRDSVTPPLQVDQWVSPLQGFRANVSQHKTDTLMTLSGLPKGAMVRLATLDLYDGITMNVSNSAAAGADSGQFTRVGTQVPDATTGEKATIKVEVGAYAGQWLPTVGQLQSIDFTSARKLPLGDNLFYNKASGTAVDTAGIAAGDTYLLNVVIPDQPAQADIKSADAGTVDQPPAEPIPDQLTEQAQRWTSGAAGQGDMAIRVEQNLRRGYFSHGLASDYPSLSGHSYGRLAKMFSGRQLVGDDEQYAVAMALMARTLGLPSRVVYGYAPTSAGDVAITGNDVSAWCEINLDGHGWVMFKPTPDKSRAPQSDTKTTQSRPRPQVENPPPPPHKPENPPPDNTPPQAPHQDEEKHRSELPWKLFGMIALGVGIPLMVMGGPLTVIALLKRRRRNLRLTDPQWSARIAGGWAELVDRGRDLGGPLSPITTRTETAAALLGRFPTAAGVPVSPAMLARRADASVFGPGEPSRRQVDEYWVDVDQAARALRGSVSWWRRLTAPFALASLRAFR